MNDFGPSPSRLTAPRGYRLCLPTIDNTSGGARGAQPELHDLRWRVDVDDVVRPGDPLFSGTVGGEYPDAGEAIPYTVYSPVAGQVLDIRIPSGATASVNEQLAVIGETGMAPKEFPGLPLVIPASAHINRGTGRPRTTADRLPAYLHFGQTLSTDRVSRHGLGWDSRVNKPVEYRIYEHRVDEYSAPYVATLATRQITSAAALLHPAIAKVVDHDAQRDSPWITFDCVEGVTATEALSCFGPLPLDLVNAIAAAAAGALDHAHRSGVTHPGLHPDDIRIPASLRDQGSELGARAVLTGFERVRTDEDFNSQVGTPAPENDDLIRELPYTAPELLHDEAVSPRSDQYALACILYELLIGTTPFDNKKPHRIITGHLEDQPPVTSARRPDIPTNIDGAIARALSKNPHERFPSCAEFASALAPRP